MAKTATAAAAARPTTTAQARREPDRGNDAIATAIGAAIANSRIENARTPRASDAATNGSRPSTGRRRLASASAREDVTAAHIGMSVMNVVVFRAKPGVTTTVRT